MPFAHRETLVGKMQTKRSSWTPLNHHLSNSHVFEERKNLVGKWFDKWSDSQRKLVLQDFFSRCSVAQMKYLRHTLCVQVPEEALDFTCVLPRVISLYIFSFLDPRSLCRCAQVSWHWSSLVELDQLWMPKCLRLGWCITFTPTPFEQGVWKRHYVETVQGLHIILPKTLDREEFVLPEVKVITSESEEPTRERRIEAQHADSAWAEFTWPRLSDFSERTSTVERLRQTPTDTIRFNYLDNLDPIEHARRALAKSSRTNPNTTQESTQKKALSASSYKRCKAKSMIFSALDLSADHKRRLSRPQWATQSTEPFSSKDPHKRMTSLRWNAGIRPGPVTNPVPRLTEKSLQASLRSHRSKPTAVLLAEVQADVENSSLR